LSFLDRRIAMVLSSSNLLATTTSVPKEFEIGNYVVTAISAMSFNGQRFDLADGLSRQAPRNVDSHFYATLNVPAGAVIDYIGLNNSNDGTAMVIGLALYERTLRGGVTLIAGISSSSIGGYGFHTDYNQSAIGYLHDGSSEGRSFLVLDIEVAPSPQEQAFGGVEVFWRRTVSPPPLEATGDGQ
jgi:hypothetical protein